LLWRAELMLSSGMAKLQEKYAREHMQKKIMIFNFLSLNIMLHGIFFENPL
jgi:hypothetical protein